jgi:uncharacterized protein YbaA (DUF1428 family)
MKKAVVEKKNVQAAKKKAPVKKAASTVKKKTAVAGKPAVAKKVAVSKKASTQKKKAPVIKHPPHGQVVIPINSDTPDGTVYNTIQDVYAKALDESIFRQQLLEDPSKACEVNQILLTDEDMTKLIDILTSKYNDVNTGAEYLEYVGSVRDHFGNDRGGDPPKYPPPAPW